MSTEVAAPIADATVDAAAVGGLSWINGAIILLLLLLLLPDVDLLVA